MGIRDDVAELYQAFDCFVFPSVHEGFGLAAIEAQTSGLPCVLADTLPSEAFICNCKKLSLKNKQKWVKEILKFSRDYKRKNTEQEIVKAGFSAKEASKQIQKFYMEISV